MVGDSDFDFDGAEVLRAEGAPAQWRGAGVGGWKLGARGGLLGSRGAGAQVGVPKH
jgi:hypothetical protein